MSASPGSKVQGPRSEDIDRSFLEWPFLDEEHRRLACELDEWASRELEEHPRTSDLGPRTSIDSACRDLVRRLGEAGWLRYAVTAPYGGAFDRLDVRSLCIARETLARYDQKP